MYLFIGLGNPGHEYSKNRHNIGFMIVDEILNENNFPSFKNKYNSLITTKNFNGKKSILLKPNTFINNSGLSASQIKSYFNLHNENIYVFHDEIDLCPSEIKIKTGGGHNGHNGIKSIDNHIGKDYHRIKIGVGRPNIPNSKNKNEIISKWVLSDFKKDEQNTWVNEITKTISKNFQELQDKNFNKFLKNL